MSKILGLDLGTNSIGWAVVDDEQNKILGSGVRIFPEGVINIGQGEQEESKNAAIETRAGPTDAICDHWDDDEHSCQSVEIMPIADCHTRPPLIIFWRFLEDLFKIQLRWRKIPHVPYFGWLVATFIVAIQSAGDTLRHTNGGNNAEYHNRRNNDSYRAVFIGYLVGQ